MEKKTIEVIVGKPVKGEVDESKVGSGLAIPPKAEGDVGGRYLYRVCVSSPSDGALNWIIADSDRYNYYRSWSDGYVFMY